MVIPTQFVFFSMSAIIGSAVLYQEFRDVTFSQFVNFAFGVSPPCPHTLSQISSRSPNAQIATTFLGVYFLTTPGETPGEIALPTAAPRSLAPVAEETPLLYNTIPDRRASVPLTGRLIKRGSQSNIALGVSSQGGLLLLASTPPMSPATPIGRPERASSRSSVTSDGATGHGWQTFESVLPSVSSRR